MGLKIELSYFNVVILYKNKMKIENLKKWNNYIRIPTGSNFLYLR